MTLWIDADACPRPVREIMLRAARRRELQLILVANSSLGLPPAPGVRQVVVPGGADVADLYIIEHAQPGDLVVTADIPLADGLVTRNITAINPRGEVYDKGSIGERLAVRNLMDELRGAGLAGRGGPAPYSDKDKQSFANALDRLLAQGLGQ
ncbi:MAG: YaiI/YqxD family protein [Pseudomonas sp.]